MLCDDYKHASRLLDRFMPRCYLGAEASILLSLDDDATWQQHEACILDRPWPAVRAACDLAKAHADALGAQLGRRLHGLWLGIYSMHRAAAHQANWERCKDVAWRGLALDGLPPTGAQKRVVQALAEEALRGNAHPDTPVELKQCTLTRLGTRGTLSLVLVVGRVGDEGTLGEVFSRSRWHLFLGPRGGIRYPSKGRARARRARNAFHAIAVGIS